MWKTAYSSSIGTSHLNNQTECEDSSILEILNSDNREDILCMFLSDGAGSAKYGGIGSNIVVNEAIKFIKDNKNNAEFNINKELGFSCVSIIKESLEKYSQENNCKLNDLACTFIGLISTRKESIIIQIGDGGCIIDLGNGLELPILPMNGEYANTTHFITDNNMNEYIKIKHFDKIILQAAIFSDGIQHLALNMPNYNIHIPFFTPLFRVLSNFKGEASLLNKAMADFLSSNNINEKTDDDKTLCLAIFME